MASRPVGGTSFPQRLQNIVIRDYCTTHKLTYKLSVTEYAMDGCYMMLEDVLKELPSLEGLVAFSMFLLPVRKERRLEVYERVLATGAELHVALENLALRSPADITRFEDTIEVASLLPAIPLGGRYDKVSGADDAFWSACASSS
jgi:sporadic carbohydrate cluster protein (TIGR04323 family)